MIPDVGKNLCLFAGPDGQIYIFFNGPLLSWGDIEYHGPDKKEGSPRYKMVFSSMDYGVPYRALHYMPFYPSGPCVTTPRVVPFHDESAKSRDGKIENLTNLVEPLWETMNPSLAWLKDGASHLSLVYWTNLKGTAGSLEEIGKNQGVWKYDQNQVLRFNNSALDDVDPDDYSTKIQCAADIYWELLTTEGGGAADKKVRYTPVIRRVHIMLVQTGNIVTDFAGGGGGGLRLHNHADNENGGFAYAVFAPGTSLTPINWKRA